MSEKVAVRCVHVTKSWWDFSEFWPDREKEPVRYWERVVLHAIPPAFLLFFSAFPQDLNSVVAMLTVVPILSSFDLFQLRRVTSNDRVDRVRSDIDLCLFMATTFSFNLGFVWMADKILGSLLVSAPVIALLGLLLCILHFAFGLILFGYRSEEVFEKR